MGSRVFARILAIIGLVVSLALPAYAQEAEYVLGTQDVFRITIFGQGGLSERFTVEADGTFTFPIFGRVKAGGLTVRQLQDDLTRRLRDGYFNDPRLTIAIEEYRSQRVFIVGEVKAPGTYGLTRSLTLVEALALAGLPTPSAGGTAIVRRRTDGHASNGPITQLGEGVIEIHSDLNALQGGMLTTNPALRDGDTIVVPRAAPVFVFGHVGRPGEYTVGRDATVRQVLALAGGVSQRGAAGRTKIVRTVEGREHELKVDLDDRVKPGDTIVVPERFF
jgi:polysaccharide export outer membrane protein